VLPETSTVPEFLFLIPCEREKRGERKKRKKEEDRRTCRNFVEPLTFFELLSLQKRGAREGGRGGGKGEEIERSWKVCLPGDFLTHHWKSKESCGEGGRKGEGKRKRRITSDLD